MRISLFLSIFLATTTLMASVTSRLANNHLAYYGEEFYQNFPHNISKAALFKILNSTHGTSQSEYDTIGNCKRNCYSHESLGYSEARKILFGELFIERDGKGQFVEDVYCGKRFYFRHVDDISNMGQKVNTEHTWPQSKFNSRFHRGMQKSDMHHLYPTDSNANNRRGNYHFGSVAQADDQLNVKDCGSSRLGNRHGKTIFTPPSEHRGNVARSLFYFATRYQMDITTEEERVLREWHESDPIDHEEKEHHEMIAKYQKVRNPFIDFPELVGKLSDI